MDNGITGIDIFTGRLVGKYVERDLECHFSELEWAEYSLLVPIIQEIFFSKRGRG